MWLREMCGETVTQLLNTLTEIFGLSTSVDECHSKLFATYLEGKSIIKYTMEGRLSISDNKCRTVAIR